ncbi:MAG: hypothetical protein S4CHLAM102_08230 [Chlamydiia bacterium]|nr:hypothetical protein [Chlamydiia bacterium]
MSLLYVIYAALGLSFLVFIHELGHYFAARWVGIRVEVFSIGFGKPFLSWNHKGVKWQMCFLLFGGYVKMAGMEREGNVEPSEIPDGYWGKAPLKRIFVALMGPVVNIVFAILVFAGIYLAGGRLRPFGEYTKVIGSIDSSSELYANGVRAGDTISSLDEHSYTGYKDILFMAVHQDKKVEIAGDKVDYYTSEKTPYSLRLTPQPDTRFGDKKLMTIGVQAPANYMVYAGGAEGGMSPASPMHGSGIETGERVFWANGQLLFSNEQLSSIVNQPLSYITFERNGKRMELTIPRVKLIEFAFTEDQFNQFQDWKFDSGLQGGVKQFTFIPYILNAYGRVVEEAKFLDSEVSEDLDRLIRTNKGAGKLMAGDQILSVDGVPIGSGLDFFQKVQTKRIVMMAAKGVSEIDHAPVTWENQDQLFTKGINWVEVNELISEIGVTTEVEQLGNLKLLSPIVPMTTMEYEQKVSELGDTSLISKTQLAQFATHALVQSAASEERKYVFLGMTFDQQKVIYNPSPFTLVQGAVIDTYRMFKGLISGNLSPKWMSGPVGIVRVMHMSWQMGFLEAFFWIAVISLNLGIFNLLPIPVLDGGHICFSLWEMITKKPIPSRTMEKMIVPFVVLLIMLFVYVTIHDVLRLAGY